MHATLMACMKMDKMTRLPRRRVLDSRCPTVEARVLRHLPRLTLIDGAI